MIDLYLRADTKAEMMQALRDAGLAWTEIDDDGNEVERVGGEPPTSVHIIGTMQRQTGTTTDDEGNEVPVYADMPGWHVNVRTRDESIAKMLSQWEAQPNTPSVLWAGGEGQRMQRPVDDDDLDADKAAYPEKYTDEAEEPIDSQPEQEPSEPETPPSESEETPQPVPEQPSPAVQEVLNTRPNILGGSNITKLLKGLSDAELRLALELETRPLVRTLIQTQLTLRGLL